VIGRAPVARVVLSFALAARGAQARAAPPDRADGRRQVGKHEPMITREAFEHAQRLLGRPGRQSPYRMEFAFTGSASAADRLPGKARSGGSVLLTCSPTRMRMESASRRVECEARLA